MSKYTTQVRFICESKAGISESAGAKKVNEILNSSWNKIFTTDTPFFDEAYRPVICKKILKHYYLREICSETAGIWELWMNTRLEELMPYYNGLYKSVLLEFDPFKDVDLKRTHNRKNDSTTEEITNTDRTASGSKDSTTSDTTHRTGEANNHSMKWDLYNDTPQGGISGIRDENYLTNARNVTDDGSGDSTEDVKSDGTLKDAYTDTENTTGDSNATINSTEDYVESVIGKQGTTSYSDLLLKFRETLINIDLLLINEFQDLFFGLW